MRHESRLSTGELLHKVCTYIVRRTYLCTLNTFVLLWSILFKKSFGMLWVNNYNFWFVEINEIAYLGTTHVQAAAYHTKFLWIWGSTNIEMGLKSTMSYTEQENTDFWNFGNTLYLEIIWNAHVNTCVSLSQLIYIHMVICIHSVGNFWSLIDYEFNSRGVTSPIFIGGQATKTIGPPWKWRHRIQWFQRKTVITLFPQQLGAGSIFKLHSVLARPSDKSCVRPPT